MPTFSISKFKAALVILLLMEALASSAMAGGFFANMANANYFQNQAAQQQQQNDMQQQQLQIQQQQIEMQKLKLQQMQQQNGEKVATTGALNDANIGAFNRIIEKFKLICDKSEYAAFYLKSPCNTKDISLIHLADSTKITQGQKDNLVKYRSEVDAVSNERIEFFRRVGSQLDNRWADYLESIQPEIDKYNLDLYNEVITWGEYNQRRKSLTAKIMANRSNFYPQPK